MKISVKILVPIFLLAGIMNLSSANTQLYYSIVYVDTFDDNVLDPVWIKTEGKRSVRPDISNNEDLVEQNGRLEFVRNGSSIGGNIFGIQIVKPNNHLGIIQVQFEYNISNRGFWYIYGDDNNDNNGYFSWRVSFVDVSDLSPGDLRIEYRNPTTPTTSFITALKTPRDLPTTGIIIIQIESYVNNTLRFSSFGDYEFHAKAIDLSEWSFIGIGVDIDHETWNASDYIYIDNYIELSSGSMITEVPSNTNNTVTSTVTQTKILNFSAELSILIPIILLYVRRNRQLTRIRTYPK